MAIVELIIGHGPIILVSGAPNFRSQPFDPRHQRRAVGCILFRPGDLSRRFTDRNEHLVGQIIDKRNKKVARSHRRIANAKRHEMHRGIKRLQ